MGLRFLLRALSDLTVWQHSESGSFHADHLWHGVSDLG